MTKCSNCGTEGHNRRTCPVTSPKDSPPPSALPMPDFPPPPPPPPSPPRPKPRVSPVEHFFTLRPTRGGWTSEYRLLLALYSVVPGAFRLDAQPHVSNGETQPHDVLIVDHPALSGMCVYHLYCVFATNSRGMTTKKWETMTTRNKGGNQFVAAFM